MTGCFPTQRSTCVAVIRCLDLARLLGWPWWVWSRVPAKTSHPASSLNPTTLPTAPLPAAVQPGHPPPTVSQNFYIHNPRHLACNLSRTWKSILLGSTAPRTLHRLLGTGWVHLCFWQQTQMNNPAVAPQTPSAALCSDSSVDHSSSPAPIPNRRQHARVIFKIKLYSFGNKNIESAHQCTSSHLKTAEHIGS